MNVFINCIVASANCGVPYPAICRLSGVKFEYYNEDRKTWGQNEAKLYDTVDEASQAATRLGFSLITKEMVM